MADCQIRCITKSQSYGGHEHITAVGNPWAPSGGWRWLTQQVVDSIDAGTNTFFVLDPLTEKRANVGVVRPAYGAAYLRTYADGLWNDNLLSLPSC